MMSQIAYNRRHCFGRLCLSLILVMGLALAGCSDDPSSSSDIPEASSINIKLQLPEQATALDRAQVTVKSLDQPLLLPIVVEWLVIGGVVEGRIDLVPVGLNRVTIELFDGLALTHRGESQVRVLMGVANEAPVTLTTVGDRIDNDVIYLHFDHQHGCIDSLIYRMGSGQELLDQQTNTRLGHYGFGSIWNAEQGTILTRFDVADDSAVVEYVNALSYGLKTLIIRWSAGSGLEVDVFVTVPLGRAYTVGSSWEPGGDKDANGVDSIGYWRTDGTGDAFALTYPTDTTLDHSGEYSRLAFSDSEYDEVFGFRFDPPRDVSVTEGTELTGPVINLTTGVHRLEFAAKDRQAYLIWSVGD
ncbi:MAG: hypothetical protein ABIE70_02440 [bacterium]